MIKLTPEKAPYYEIGENVKIYKALMNQSGSNAPVPTILKNTLGNIVWTRLDTGVYDGTLANAFGLTNTWLMIQIQNEPNFTSSQAISHVDENTIRLSTNLPSGAESDDILANTSIEINIFN